MNLTSAPDFDGVTYVASRDKARLTTQLDRVREAMSDGKWRTLEEVAIACYCPEASASSRLRDLRKPKFGSHNIERRCTLMSRQWEYRMVGQLELPL